MGAPSYKFKFQIVDETTGQIVESDFTYLSDHDQTNIGIHVSQMLRNWINFARAEYEAENYQVPA